MTQEAREKQKLAQVIADATVAGDLSSKSLAITLHNKGYRLVPELKMLTDGEIGAIGGFTDSCGGKMYTCYYPYLQAQLDSIKKQIEEVNK